MIQSSSFETVKALKKLGFEPDDAVLSDDGAGLSYNFGNLTLSACRVLNLSFAQIILVSGVYASPHTIAHVEIQLPLRVASIEQCAAFIAWGINEQIGRNFVPLVPTDWLELGRNNFDTLLWIKEQKLYEARPQCAVERDWLKLALRDLRSLLPTLAESDSLSFNFQNEIFSIRANQKLFALPAAGNNWKSQYEITAANFRDFPKRLNCQEIEISVWENYLHLAGWRYPIDATIEVRQT